MFTVCLDDHIINEWMQTDELSEVNSRNWILTLRLTPMNWLL